MADDGEKAVLPMLLAFEREIEELGEREREKDRKKIGRFLFRDDESKDASIYTTVHQSRLPR